MNRTSFRSILESFDSSRKNLCRIPLINLIDETKSNRVSFHDLKNNYEFNGLLNQSHLIVALNSNSYSVSLVSILKCLVDEKVTLSNLTNSMANLDPIESNSTSFELDFLFGPDIQPVLYVGSILFFFTIIFGLIMMFSYRFNRQDAEIHESQMILKDWKNFKNRGSVISSIGLETGKKANKMVKFKIEDWSMIKADEETGNRTRRFSSVSF